MADIKKIRAKYEKKIIDLMNKIDVTGYNGNHYKKVFAKMNDKQFIEMAKQMIIHDDYLFSVDIDSAEKLDDKHAGISFLKVKRLSEELNIPINEYLFLPHRNPDGKPMCTLTKVPILYLQIRRFFQQMLSHKNAISNNNAKANPISGQVTGEDKTASTTNVQTYALTVLNQKSAIKEFLGPRADDNVSKEEMLTVIEKTGSVRLSDLKIETHNKQSILTSEAFAKAACVNIRFASTEDDAMKAAKAE
jgi:hypothetical protein